MAREGRAGLIRSSLSGAHIRYTKYPKRFWESPVDALQAALGACRAGEGRGGSGLRAVGGFAGSFFCRFAVAILLGFISIRSPRQLSQRALKQRRFLFTTLGRETGDKSVARDLIFIMKERVLFIIY